MSQNTILDSKRMFEHACAFCDCARSCEIEPNTIEYRLRSHTSAGIVNSAFACEIFIKTLLVHQGRTVGQIRGHKLKDLWQDYKSLDNATATSIEQNIREWYNSSDNSLFDRLLDEASNAFEYWRYIYEQDSATLNINFLRGFRTLLREVSCQQLFGKSWNEYKNQ